MQQTVQDIALSVIWCDAAGKTKRIEIIDQKVPGQKDMFAPVLSGVPGQMTRCPCGFGAYGYMDYFVTDDAQYALRKDLALHM